MTTPFDDPDGHFTVLVNDRGEHSLWPASVAVPHGWTRTREAGDRAAATTTVLEAWDRGPIAVPRAHRDTAGALAGLEIDHIRLYVGSVAAARTWLADRFGLADVTAQGTSGGTTVLSGGGVRVVIEQPSGEGHPGAAWIAAHGDGVADVALRVADAAAAFAEAVARGARPVPARGPATVAGIGDLTHTFVTAGAGLRDAAAPPADATAPPLGLVDHLAVCVEAGELDATVAFYREVLGADVLFSETLDIGPQRMTTTVVRCGEAGLTLTLIAPDRSRTAGHVHAFLDEHGGPGVQHVAFSTPDVVAAVDAATRRGTAFLPAPGAYYDALPVDPGTHGAAALRARGILVDQDHDGQLFQIFTRTVHERGTLFLELIERAGARSFGSGNISALYRAAESERTGGDPR